MSSLHEEENVLLLRLMFSIQIFKETLRQMMICVRKHDDLLNILSVISCFPRCYFSPVSDTFIRKLPKNSFCLVTD